MPVRVRGQTGGPFVRGGRLKCSGCATILADGRGSYLVASIVGTASYVVTTVVRRGLVAMWSIVACCSYAIRSPRETVFLNFAVQAVNSGGSGPWSDWERTTQPPSVPRNVRAAQLDSDGIGVTLVSAYHKW